MKRVLLIAVGTALAAGLTLASGAIHGRLTSRWVSHPAMKAAAERLKSVPTQFRDWRMQREEEMDEVSANVLECAAYIDRQYVNDKTDEVVHVTVILGPAGPISVHTPEICLSSRRYRQMEERKPMRVPSKEPTDEPDKLWGLTFKSRELSGHLLRVYYGWSRGGPWSAPESARRQHVGSPYVYKIQVAAPLPPLLTRHETDPCKDFLVEFLPVLQHYLVEQ